MYYFQTIQRIISNNENVNKMDSIWQLLLDKFIKLIENNELSLHRVQYFFLYLQYKNHYILYLFIYQYEKFSVLRKIYVDIIFDTSL